MPVSLARAFASALALAIPLAAQTFTWTNLAPSTLPPVRWFACSVFDPVRERMVLCGGRDISSGTPMNDTWEWDGASWAQRIVSTPPSADSCALAFDPVRQRVVMLNQLSSTSEWDGTTWLQRNPVNSPPPRTGHCMAFDAVAARIMMFGSNAQGLNDTWAWDGNNWQQLFPATSPSARSHARMVGAGPLARIVMYGGMPLPSVPNNWLRETWVWTGTNWQQLPGSAPTAAPINGAITPIGLVFDAARQRVVLVHGQSGVPGAPATWQWDGTSWTSVLTAPAVTSCLGLCAAFDTARNEVVVHAASSPSPNLPQTWVMRPTVAAVATSFGSGCGAPSLSLAADPTGLPLLGHVARAAIDQAPTLVAGVAIGFSNAQAGPLPLPYDLTALGMPGCSLLQSNELLGLGATPSSATSLAFQLAIPNLGNLLGVHAYVQAYVFAPGANPAQIVVSNGLDWRLGNS